MAIETITIKKFVDYNFPLFATIGVFGALIAYFSGIDNPASPYLTFSALLIFLLLCIELWRSFPKSEEASNLLHFFEAFFIWFVLSILGYISYFVYLKNAENKLIVLYFELVIYSAFTIIAVFLFTESKIYEKIRIIAPMDSKLSPFIRGLTFIAVLEVAFVLAYLFIYLIKSIF